jgi:hypothetical protein
MYSIGIKIRLIDLFYSPNNVEGDVAIGSWL